MASKFWIFLTFFFLIGFEITARAPVSEGSEELSEICPSGCQCSYDGKEVDCTGLRLTCVPNFFSFPPQMEKLNLSDNLFAQFPVWPGLLANFIWLNLKHLNLDFNVIKSIESNNFEALGSLELLSLSNNAIDKIEFDGFAGLSNLMDLDLSHNSLVSLYEGVFDDLVSLQTVDLSQNPWESGIGCMWIKSSESSESSRSCDTGDCYTVQELLEMCFCPSSDFIWPIDGQPIKLWSFLSRQQDGFFRILSKSVDCNGPNCLGVDAGGTLDSGTNYFLPYLISTGQELNDCGNDVAGMTQSIKVTLGIPGGLINQDPYEIYLLYNFNNELVARPVYWDPEDPATPPTFWEGFSLTNDLPDFLFCFLYIEYSNQFWITNIKEVNGNEYEPYQYLSTNSLGVISAVEVYETEMYPGSSNPSLIYTAIFYPNDIIEFSG